MKSNTLSALVLVVATGALLSACTVPGMSSTSPTPVPTPQATATPSLPTISPGTSPANTTYFIEGQPVQLSEGMAEEPIPGSSTVITTEIFGTPTMGDLNGDKLPDAAVLLMQSPGGSGTFFYMAAALAQADGTYLGTNGVLVGDGISPQNKSITDLTILFNYATRAEGAPQTAPNDLAQSTYYQVEGKVLVEVPAPQP